MRNLLKIENTFLFCVTMQTPKLGNNLVVYLIYKFSYFCSSDF